MSILRKKGSDIHTFAGLSPSEIDRSVEANIQCSDGIWGDDLESAASPLVLGVAKSDRIAKEFSLLRSCPLDQWPGLLAYFALMFYQSGYRKGESQTMRKVLFGEGLDA